MQGIILTLTCLLSLSAGFEDKTIVQWLIDNNYHTLVNALNITDLYNTLNSDEGGPFTVFVPSDTVFYQLGPTELQDILSDPGKLTQIMKYHVVPKFIIVSTISGPVSELTLNSEELFIEPYLGGLLINNMSRVHVGYNDIVLRNGVVQPVDTVMIPRNIIDITITQTLLSLDGEFGDFFLALILADMTKTLDDGDFTVFAPVNSAFTLFKDTLLDPAAPNAIDVYRAVLSYHVVPGGRTLDLLTDGQTLYTLHGLPIKVNIEPSGVYINNVRVIDPNIKATNGIIHGIDTILIPSDIQQITQG